MISLLVAAVFPGNPTRSSGRDGSTIREAVSSRIDRFTLDVGESGLHLLLSYGQTGGKVIRAIGK